MSDLDRPQQTKSGPFVHYCSADGCNKWGGWGFSSPHREPRWWCSEHYPHKQSSIMQEAAANAEMKRNKIPVVGVIQPTPISTTF
jgi:hypothetical protein